MSDSQDLNNQDPDNQELDSQDIEEIIEANSRFYEALGGRDLELMKTVFVADGRAGCTHPGWVMLRGYDAIIQSWENVFDPDDKLDINLHNVTVDLMGDTAWVTCIQELTYIMRDPVMMNVSVSTNIFEKTGAGWLMLIHHASPVPFTRESETEDQSSNLQ